MLVQQLLHPFHSLPIPSNHQYFITQELLVRHSAPSLDCLTACSFVGKGNPGFSIPDETFQIKHDEVREGGGATGCMHQHREKAAMARHNFCLWVPEVAQCWRASSLEAHRCLCGRHFSVSCTERHKHTLFGDSVLDALMADNVLHAPMEWWMHTHIMHSCSQCRKNKHNTGAWPEPVMHSM